MVQRRQLDPVNCPCGRVLESLQASFYAGLTHSTLKVYVVDYRSTWQLYQPTTPLSVASQWVYTPSYTFSPRGALRLRMRPQVRKLVLCGGSGCYSIFLRDTGPAHFVLFHTRQGFKSLAAWASHSHSVSTQLEFLKGNIPGKACNHSPKGMRRCVSGPYFQPPCERLLHS